MKSRSFRLEPVLRIRRVEERASAMLAAQASASARNAQMAADSLDQSAAGSVVPATSGGEGFVHAMVRAGMRAAEASAARYTAQAQAEAAQEANVAWTVAAQRTKGLERLREKHVAAVQRADEQAEVRLIDDLVTRAYATRAQPKPQGNL